jgi:hypothetical protein
VARIATLKLKLEEGQEQHILSELGASQEILGVSVPKGADGDQINSHYQEATPLSAPCNSQNLGVVSKPPLWFYSRGVQ